MLQLQYLRENTREAIERLLIKNVYDAEIRVEEILSLDNVRRELQHKADTVKAEANAIAKEIGKLFKEGKTDEANAKKQRTSELKATEKELDEKLAAAEQELNAKLISLPNTQLQLPTQHMSTLTRIILCLLLTHFFLKCKI